MDDGCDGPGSPGGASELCAGFGAVVVGSRLLECPCSELVVRVAGWAPDATALAFADADAARCAAAIAAAKECGACAPPGLELAGFSAIVHSAKNATVAMSSATIGRETFAIRHQFGMTGPKLEKYLPRPGQGRAG